VLTHHGRTWLRLPVRSNETVLAYIGRTVHIVPTEHGVDAAVGTFHRKAAVFAYAKCNAAGNQPSQVVLFTAAAGVETVAQYQLPQYQIPQATAGAIRTSLFDTTVKALVIGGLVAAGVTALHDLVRELKRPDAARTWLGGTRVAGNNRTV